MDMPENQYQKLQSPKIPGMKLQQNQEQQANELLSQSAEHPQSEQEQEQEQAQEQLIDLLTLPYDEEWTLKKRSAEAKRLPAHYVLDKHLRLAETSPQLLGVDSAEQLREIWAKNLPYPHDGNPALPGGPIIKRSAGRESRVVELREKESGIRQTHGRPIKTRPVSFDVDEKDFDVRQVKNDIEVFSSLSNLGYTLDDKETDEQITETLQQQQPKQNNQQPCQSDRCRGNAERNRDKDGMRRGDVGLVKALLQPNKSVA